METFLYFLGFCAVAADLFLLRVLYLHEKLPARIEAKRFEWEVRLPGSIVDIEKEWSEKSWAGSGPLDVAALGHIIADRNRNGYHKPLHLTTSYYSQVSHLVKKGRLPTAFVFYTRSKLYGLRAHLQRSGESAFREAKTTFKKAIELEVIGAPYFLPVAVPVIGMPFRQTALEYLLAADEEISWHLKVAREAEDSGNEPVRPDTRIEKGIIWSKLFRLTKDEAWRARVLAISFKSDKKSRKEDHEQLTRIAKHIGFRSADQLLDNLSPAAKRKSEQDAKEEDAKLSPEMTVAQQQSEEDAKIAKDLSEAVAQGMAQEAAKGPTRVEPSSPGPKAVLPRPGLRLAGKPGEAPAPEGGPSEPAPSSGDGSS